MEIRVSSRHMVRGAIVLIACFFATTASAEYLPLPPNLIGLGSPPGNHLLIGSKAREAYWPLSLQFVTQQDQAYCGVATLVMVLNALKVQAPATPDIEPFRTFTQANVLSNETERVLARAVLAEHGMTLDQFGQLLTSYAVTAVVVHADQSSLNRFRRLASRQLAGTDRFVVVNYLRKAIGQEGGGHISPLGAYDAVTDRFLVLDVSRYKYPPVWVRTRELFAAMNTIDTDNGERHRGFVLIRPAQ